MCKEAETRLMCDAGQGEEEKGLAMDSRSGPAGAASGLPWLLPGEEKFLLKRTTSLGLYLKVVLLRHQDFQHKVLYMINFF